MNEWLAALPVLAQGEQPKGISDSPLGMLFPLVLIALVFYFLILRPQQRERAARDSLLKQLKKNDRVVTIGGVIGQVVSISPDEKEIVLKVDDNTRIRFRRSAIQSVLAEGEAAEDQPKPSS